MRAIVFDITENAEDGTYCAAMREEAIFTWEDCVTWCKTQQNPASSDIELPADST